MGRAGDNSILVSVVVPTRNRCALVRDLLESLQAQTLEPERFEAIIVDNCSTDHTEEMVGEMRAKARYRVIYHRMPEDRGPVVSRNTACRMAKGGILAFTDSDCRVSPQWLQTAVEALDRHPQAAFITGPVRDKPEQPVKFFSVCADSREGEDPTYRACNIFYRTSVFWEMGGFDESAFFGDAGFLHYECGDIDLAWRVKEKGYGNVFVPELVVYHEVWHLPPTTWLLKHTQWMPLALFLKRHPRLDKEFLWWGPISTPLNALFYLLLLGALLAITVNVWFLVLALPYLAVRLKVLGLHALTQPLRTLAQLVFMCLGQCVICGSLLYGSIRARKIVL